MQAKKFTPPEAKPGNEIPKDTVVRDYSKEQSAAERIAEIERRTMDQRRVLNTSKHIAPIVRAIITHPGSLADPQKKAEAINGMVQIASKASSRFMSDIAPDLSGKGWANAAAFGVCASMVASEWEKNGSCDHADQVLSPEFFRLITDSLTKDEHAIKWLESSGNVSPAKNESEAATMIRMSLLKGFAPLLADIQAFSFWNNLIGPSEVESLTRKMCDTLASVAAENANRTADQNGIDADMRIMLWQNTIARTFSFAREEYRALASRAFAELDASPDAASRSVVRRKWAKSDEIVASVAKCADNTIRLMDGIVEKLLNLADEKPRDGERMKG